MYSQAHVELVVQGCNNRNYSHPLGHGYGLNYLPIIIFFLHTSKFMTKITKRHFFHQSLPLLPYSMPLASRSLFHAHELALFSLNQWCIFMVQ